MDPSKNNEHDGDVGTTLRAIREVRKIRYTDQEWDTIVERARSCSQPPARYVRAVSLGVVPRSSRAQASAAVVHELGRIGNTLAALRADVRSHRVHGDAGLGRSRQRDHLRGADVAARPRCATASA